MADGAHDGKGGSQLSYWGYPGLPKDEGAKYMQKAAFLGTPSFKHERKSSVDFKGDHFKQNPHPEPVNIFRSHAVSRKEEIRIAAWAQLQMEWKQQFKKFKGKKKSIYFLPPKLSLL